MSAIKSKHNQIGITLPIKWARCRELKHKDKIFMFSLSEHSSPLLICTLTEYMRNPHLKKLVDQIVEILEKSEEVI